MSTSTHEVDSSPEQETTPTETVGSQRTPMNIPNASYHADANLQSLQEREYDDYIYNVQSEALERVLNESLTTNEITVALSHPLHEDLAVQLSERGYTFGTSYVSTTVNGETQVCNTLTVFLQDPVSRRHRQMRGQRHFETLFSPLILRTLGI